jgi:hypothetical protein
MEELPKTLEELAPRDKELDKAIKLNWYLLEKYGDEFFSEESLKEFDIPIDVPKVMQYILLFDRLYEKLCEKYPEPWYHCECCCVKD